MPVIFERIAAKNPELEQPFHEFMLAELANTTESFFKSEEDGERRVVFFLTLAAGAGALLAFLLGKDASYDPAVRYPSAIVVLLGLLAFGFVVLRRVIRRNAMTDDYKKKLIRVRKWFTPNESDPRIAYIAFDPFAPDQHERKPSLWKLKTGGWLEVHLLVCAFLVGALLSALINTPTWGYEVAVAVVSSVAAWPLLAKGPSRFQFVDSVSAVWLAGNVRSRCSALALCERPAIPS
jgi:hypothetical protein